MKTKRIYVVFANILAIAFVASYYLWPSQADRLAREYPASPFAPFPPEYVRIISNRESPPKDKSEQYDAFLKEQDDARKFAWSQGCLSQLTDDEREAYRLAVNGTDYASARKLVENVLVANGKSIAGRFALATITEESDANFPKALFLLQKLRRELHSAGVKSPNDEHAREWYLRILYNEQDLLENLSRFEDCLAVIDIIDHLYEPMPRLRVWPLMRLRRFDDARKYVDQVIASGRYPSRSLNDRFALAIEMGDRENGYQVGKQLHQETNGESAVYTKNFASACIEHFQFGEATEMLVSATTMPIKYFGSPFTKLASQHANNGSLREAWNDLQKAQVQRQKRARHTLVFDQSNFDGTAAYILFLFGQSDDAFRIEKTNYETPNRSNTSNSKRDNDFLRGFSYFTTLKNECHSLEERLAIGESEGWKTRAELARRTTDLWAVRQQLRSIVQEGDYLTSLFRPSLPGSPYPSSPFHPDVADLVPVGIANEALRQARQAEKAIEANPYFDAIEAELKWKQRDLVTSFDLCEQCLKTLDRSEVVLRGRVSAIAADCLRRLNRIEDAIPYYLIALKDGPAFFRYLDIAIPISIAEDGHEFASRWARRLIRSPRFVLMDGCFSLIMKGEETQVQFELLRPDGTKHCRGQFKITSSAKAIELATSELIQRIASPNFQLSSSEIHSIENAIFAVPDQDRTTKLLESAVGN